MKRLNAMANLVEDDVAVVDVVVEVVEAVASASRVSMACRIQTNNSDPAAPSMATCQNARAASSGFSGPCILAEFVTRSAA